MIQEIKKYFNLKNVTFQFSLFLLALLGASVIDYLIYEPSMDAKINMLLGLVSVYVVAEGFWIYNFYTKKIPNLNYLHLGITATIIFLLIHPTTEWWIYPLVTAVAIFFKSTLRYKGQPIFNPAGFGVYIAFVLSLLFVNGDIVSSPVVESWWGADIMFTFVEFSPILWVLSIGFFVGFLYFAKRFNKIIHGSVYIATYILTYLAYSFLVKQITIEWGQFFMGMVTGSFIFLAYVMVTEPKTSPVVKDHQLLLGIAGGLVLFMFTNYVPEVAPQYATYTGTTTFALIILNLMTFFVKNWNSLFRPKAPVVASQVGTAVVPEKTIAAKPQAVSAPVTKSTIK